MEFSIGKVLRAFGIDDAPHISAPEKVEQPLRAELNEEIRRVRFGDYAEQYPFDSHKSENSFRSRHGNRLAAEAALEQIVKATINPGEWDKVTMEPGFNMGGGKSGWCARGMSLRTTPEAKAGLNIWLNSESASLLDGWVLAQSKSGNNVEYRFRNPEAVKEGSAVDVHQQVVVYFEKQPSDSVLQDLGQTVKKFSRVKIGQVQESQVMGQAVDEAPWVALSVVSEIPAEHTSKLLSELEKIDSKLSEQVAGWIVQDQKNHTLRMSESMYYAIVNVLDAKDIQVNYSKLTGFQLEKMNSDAAGLRVFA